MGGVRKHIVNVGAAAYNCPLFSMNLYFFRDAEGSVPYIFNVFIIVLSYT